MASLNFYLTRDRKFGIGAGALTMMDAYAQRSEVEPEAGGLLLGRFLRDDAGIVVDEVTTPGPTDEAGRYAFGRNDPSHQEIADRRWEESNGTCCTLGTWHTHPEPNPTPSTLDLSEWRRHAREWTYEGDALYFAIVGAESVGVWEVTRTGGVRALANLSAEAPR